MEHKVNRNDNSVTQQRAIPGQRLTDLPDNWKVCVKSEMNNVLGLVYIPESEIWMRVSSYPRRSYSRINAVGRLSIEYIDTWASDDDIREFAETYKNKYDADGVDEDVDAIRHLADNWDVVERTLAETTDWVQGEWLGDRGPTAARSSGREYPIAMADADWQVEVPYRCGRPEEAIERAMKQTEYEIPNSVLCDELINAGLIPRTYRYQLTLDESSVGMEYYMRGLIELGASPAAALDYYMVEVANLTQTAWGEERDVDQSTVSENVNQAKDLLD